MLSPSHPGPYKATHLTKCDRTVIATVFTSELLSRFSFGKVCANTDVDRLCGIFCSFPNGKLNIGGPTLTIPCGFCESGHLLG